MRFPRLRGETSVKVRIFIPDNTSTTGAGCTGLTSGSTNLAIAYSRALSGGTEVTGANIVSATAGTWGDPGAGKIGFIVVDAAKFPGLYELQFHDGEAFGAQDASEAVYLNVYEKTTTALKIGPNMVLIPLVPWNYQDGVRMGMTALPAYVAGGKGGLPILDSSTGLVITGYGPAAASAVASSITGVTFPTNFADMAIAKTTGLVTVADTQKVDVNTIKTRAVTDVGSGKTVYVSDAAYSTLTQTNITGGAYDVTNASCLIHLASGQKIDVDTVKTKGITCANDITILASVGTVATSTAQTGDVYAIAAAKGTGDLAAIKAGTDLIVAAPPNWSDLAISKGTGNVTIAAGYKADLVDSPNSKAVTAIQNGLATTTNVTTAVSDLEKYGDSAWKTATGFAVAKDVTDGVSAVETYGDGKWTTATGFSKAGDKMDLVDSPNSKAVAVVQAGIATSAILKEVNQALNGQKVVIDRDANTCEVYDTNGTTLLFTITRTTRGNVDTLTRS